MLKKCLTECGNIINLCMKFQDIFTRPKGILLDSVRGSDTYSEDWKICHICSNKRPGPGALQLRSKNDLETKCGQMYKKFNILQPFCMLFSNFGQVKDFCLINESKIV